MEAHKVKVGSVVLHNGAQHIAHAIYVGTCGRTMVAVAPMAAHGEAIVCNNVPVADLKEHGSEETKK
jgi:hypothetical protein